jgi:hypothetical protein
MLGLRAILEPILPKHKLKKIKACLKVISTLSITLIMRKGMTTIKALLIPLSVAVGGQALV